MDHSHADDQPSKQGKIREKLRDALQNGQAANLDRQESRYSIISAFDFMSGSQRDIYGSWLFSVE